VHLFQPKPAQKKALDSELALTAGESRLEESRLEDSRLEENAPDESVLDNSIMEEGTSLDGASAGSNELNSANEATAALPLATQSEDAIEAFAENSVSGDRRSERTNGADDSLDQTSRQTGVQTTDSPTLAGTPARAPNDAANETRNQEIVQVVPDADAAMDRIVSSQLETLSLVLAVGFILMGLIHVVEFRRRFYELVSASWKVARTILIDTPLKVLRLPLLQKIWRDRTFVKFRRYVLTPAATSIMGARFLPWLISGQSLSWWWVGAIAVLFSLALNSRLGKDAQELSAEWIGNAWYKLRARVVMAVIDWIIDLFRMILNFVERFLYAVDEWLRFQSGESWLSVVAKAVLGVIWSFVAFLIRIYINLLIEPTLHPVKHFPVVTVAHKIFFPFIEQISVWMFNLFTPYMGKWLSGVVTGFNIFFLPGIFGFVVWELKENWRLYHANRQKLLTPVPVGSHGETVARLLRPGFHSGTLPKLFRRLRRLEHQNASLKRFSARRAGREQLEHVETAIRSFVERELIRLLELCPVWHGTGLQCGHIHAASNSFSVDVECPRIGETPVQLLFQEQSGWVVASVSETGWLRFASADQIRSFQTAVEGFYRKSGIDLVREQLETNLIRRHPYDINADGLAVWPKGAFDCELQIDLNRKGIIRPIPAGEAAAAGIGSVERETIVFSESGTQWSDWEALWTTPSSASGLAALPSACSNRSGKPVLPAIR